jgi:hypothetical protein
MKEMGKGFHELNNESRKTLKESGYENIDE